MDEKTPSDRVEMDLRWSEWARNGSKVAAYTEALSKSEQGQDERAYELYLFSAQKNYAPAQNNLGWLYRTGKGCQRSPEAAYCWFYLASIQGYPLAVHNLGEMFLNGDGVKKELNLATELFIYGSSFAVVPPDEEIVEGCNWAIFECRKELIWLHLQESFPVGRTRCLAVFWARLSAEDLAIAYPDEQQEYRKSAQVQMSQLGDQLWSRLNPEEKEFVEYLLSTPLLQLFSLNDTFGFPLTTSPFCPRELLLDGSESQPYGHKFS
jgi:hypothetical protein